jgi:prephenate dehydratase
MHEPAHRAPPSPRRRRIAYQGEPGAFGEAAVHALWGEDAISVPCETFHAVLAAVRSRSVDGAVLPIENLTAGPVTSALDALDDYSEGMILGAAIDLPVVQALLGVAGATLDKIRIITSHPVALAQCHRFLSAFGATLEPHLDTAGAARMVAERGDRHLAAIAGHAAAMRYGLTILSDAIQDAPDNWTRFVRIEGGAG